MHEQLWLHLAMHSSKLLFWTCKNLSGSFIPDMVTKWFLPPHPNCCFLRHPLKELKSLGSNPSRHWHLGMVNVKSQ
uniref:Uncharacterized protein n=1 Tax=Oryza glumipatula TaxID=40148 RepID=A0A0D9ZR89_9ORYZ